MWCDHQYLRDYSDVTQLIYMYLLSNFDGLRSYGSEDDANQLLYESLRKVRTRYFDPPYWKFRHIVFWRLATHFKVSVGLQS